MIFIYNFFFFFYFSIEIPLKFHPQFGKTKRTISDLWYCADNDEHTRKIMKDFKPYKGEISKMNWVSLNQNFKTSACMNWDNFETEVVEPVRKYKLQTKNKQT